MQTLETSLVLSLVFMLLFYSLALLPQFYSQAQAAARLEVLALYVKQAGQSLYQIDKISYKANKQAALQSSPQRALELADLVGDYYNWFSSWLTGDRP